MKKTLRKLAAFSAACVMTLSLTACGEDTATIGKIAGEDIPAGVYLYHATSVYRQTALQKTEEQATVWDITVEGKTAEQHIADETLMRVKKLVAIEKKFDELGLSLTEKEKDYYAASAENAYKQSEEAFSTSGIGLDSFTRIVENDAKYAAVFEAYYDAETGIDPVKTSEINKHLKDNYARIEYIEISLKDIEGNLLKGADKEKAINRAKNYLKRAENEDMGALLYEEYNVLLKSMADADGTEFTETEYNPDEIEDYAFEQILNKNDMTSPFPHTVKEEVFNHKDDGKAFLVEGSDSYYVIKRYNILEREGIVDTYKGTVLQELKGDEFAELETKWAEELDIEWNEAAKERYAPKKLKVAE